MSVGAEGVQLVIHPGQSSAAPERIEGASIESWREQARAMLGLPDRAVIATGHQSECWHAGILAKNFWAQALAVREDATAVHLVVDQDGFDGMHVEWPFQRDDGWWGVRGHRFAAQGDQTAAMRCPAFRPHEVACGEGVGDVVAHGVMAIHAALLQHMLLPDAAMQGAATMLHLAKPWLAQPHIVRASDLMKSELAQRLLQRMLKDPAACAESFNKALNVAPRSARFLRMRGLDVELPVWLLGEQGERKRANAAELRQALHDGTTIVPRAFFMSALARTVLADRFVHGLGGGIYEHATDQWMRGWLGWTPPAFDVVSANLRMTLPMPAAIPAARISYRRAWCDPNLIQDGGYGPSAFRQRALEMIAALPPRDASRRAIYQEMIHERNAGRLRSAGELESLGASEAAVGAARVARELSARRTWCFALLKPTQLTHLRETIERRAAE